MRTTVTVDDEIHEAAAADRVRVAPNTQRGVQRVARRRSRNRHPKGATTATRPTPRHHRDRRRLRRHATRKAQRRRLGQLRGTIEIADDLPLSRQHVDSLAPLYGRRVLRRPCTFGAASSSDGRATGATIEVGRRPAGPSPVCDVRYRWVPCRCQACRSRG